MFTFGKRSTAPSAVDVINNNTSAHKRYNSDADSTMSMSEPRRSGPRNSFRNQKKDTIPMEDDERYEQQQREYDKLLVSFTDLKLELAEIKTDLGNKALQLRKLEQRNTELEDVEERNISLQEKLCEKEQENDTLRHHIKQLEKKILLSTMALSSSSSRHSRMTTTTSTAQGTHHNNNYDFHTMLTPPTTTKPLNDSSYSTRTTDDMSIHSQYSSRANSFVYVPSQHQTPSIDENHQRRIPVENHQRRAPASPISTYSSVTTTANNGADIWTSRFQLAPNDNDDNCSRATSSRIREHYHHNGDDDGDVDFHDDGEREFNNNNGGGDLEAIDLSDPFSHPTEVVCVKHESDPASGKHRR